MRKGLVYVHQLLAGQIIQDENGYQFSYFSDYLNNPKAVQVSFTLPLSSKIYRSNVLFPFFDGLIPEGWLLEVVVNNWKIPRHDRMGILLTACHDCVGVVSIVAEENVDD